MFKKDNKIAELGRKIERLEEDLEILKNKNSNLEEENNNLNDTIKKYQKRLNDEEYKNLSSEKEIQRANNQKELSEMKLKDIENILEEYRQLPDLKNMIDNLSNLTTPSIDKLISLVKNTDFKELTNFNERITNIEQKLDELIKIFSSRRMF